MPLSAGLRTGLFAAALALCVCTVAGAADEGKAPGKDGKAPAQKPAAAKPFPPTPVRAERAKIAPAVDVARAQTSR